MGGTSWSDNDYSARQAHRAATNTSAFQYDQTVKSTGSLKVHDAMNVKGVKWRESRDSDAHPESRAIAVVFDVTGSMGSIPVVLQKKLGQLMRILLAKSYIDHPQILFGAVGDAYTDHVPLQIGQFESGLEMDDDLGKLVLEGNGGGQGTESYELIPYFFARKTAIDCYEKRGIKGYLFTIGDEAPHKVVPREHVEQLIGDKLEADIPLEQIAKEVLAKYEWFHIVPTNTSCGHTSLTQNTWKSILGERVIELRDPEAVCETIVMTIGLVEGAIDDLNTAQSDLAAAGVDKQALTSASTALATIASGTTRTLGKVAQSNLPAAVSSGSTRL